MLIKILTTPFIGFNALNNAEQHLFQELLEHDRALVYWDSETYFAQNNHHSASHFTRAYFTSWKKYQTSKPLFVTNNYISDKTFNIIEASSTSIAS